ncbi:MAG: DNA polymerase III, subunit gamma and tau [Burkholderiales bacterium PBB1]|nr:MAG: DNA polymerase III, subunit gamma and tau [Burkholderiales bacterium PBB1]
MSYLVLARKYRPRNFDTLVGQEHVVQALSNALTQGRLHHAYLFTGTRGVGKTTVSRILAKALNCTGVDGQGGVTAHPCGVCNACRDIDADRFIDYMELDAASNRGIDEIRDLIERAAYKPTVGRYKVFMIDEAHQLTRDSFNALLKTLEEPPDYLKFVLATTEPDKMLPTVLSRCLQFNLRPMGLQTLQEHLARVLADEDIAAEPGALRLLARAARGSMRDALSITDQAVAFGGGALLEAGVRDMLGAVDRRHAIRLIDALAAGDGAALLAEADALRALGLSARGTLEEMAELLQQMAVAQAVPDALDESDAESAAAVRLATMLAADQTQLFYSMALHGRAELALAPDEHSGLVMVLLRMLAFGPPAGTRTVAPASVKVEAAAKPMASAALARTPAPARAATPPVVPSPPPRAAEPQPPPWVDAPWDDEVGSVSAAVTESPPEPAASSAHAPAPPDVASVAAPVSAPTSVDAPDAVATPLGNRWTEIVQALMQAGSISALVRELAIQSQCVLIDETASPLRWVLQVERETLRSPAHRDKLEAALALHLGRPVKLEVQAGPVQDTPALRASAERLRRQREAEQIIADDPVVRTLMSQFSGARIVPGSVKYQ